MSLDEGVRRYIDTKRNVLRNMARIQNILATQALGADEARRIQAILDDPFADGLPAGS